MLASWNSRCTILGRLMERDKALTSSIPNSGADFLFSATFAKPWRPLRLRGSAFAENYTFTNRSDAELMQ
jgi:hypothetical protein